MKRYKRLMALVPMLLAAAMLPAQKVGGTELESFKKKMKVQQSIPRKESQQQQNTPSQPSSQAPSQAPSQLPRHAADRQVTESAIEYVGGSFRNLAGEDRMPSESDMGQINMTSYSIDWPADADGLEQNSALIVFQFENLSPEDIQKFSFNLSGGKVPVKREIKTQNNRTTVWLFVPPTGNMDITASHPRLGTTRIPGVRIDARNIYTAHIRAKGLQNISITSQPAGAVVYFDGQKQPGITPMTIRDVPMGNHNISLKSPDRNIAGDLSEQVISVSSTTTTFNFSLYHKRDIIIVSEPSEAYLKVEKDGMVKAEGIGRVELKNAEYGTYLIIGTDKGEASEQTLIVNAMTASTVTVKVIGSRNISFQAIQNNENITGARVNVDGEYIGTTPVDHQLYWGSYRVDMSYNGYTQSKTLNVDKNSDAKCILKLPNHRKHTNNPFNIDYKKREWGIAVNYVQRNYALKINGRSTNYNVWGEQKPTHGLQVGIAWQPYFGYGQGMNTGLYYQGFFYSADEGGDKMSHTDSQLYIPLQYQFRLPLSESFSVFVNAGAAMSLGLENKVSFGDGYDKEEIDVGYGYNSEYDLYMPKACQFQMVFGAGLQIKALQVEFKYSKGLTDNEDLYYAAPGDKVSCKANQWSVGLGLMF